VALTDVQLKLHAAGAVRIQFDRKHSLASLGFVALRQIPALSPEPDVPESPSPEELSPSFVFYPMATTFYNPLYKTG